jgi:hypothetical protein
VTAQLGHSVVAASNLDPSIMPGQFTLPLFSHYSQQQTELQASAERQNFSAQWIFHALCELEWNWPGSIFLSFEEPAGQFIKQRRVQERKIASGEKSEALSFTICYTSHSETVAQKPTATHFFPKRLFLENVHAPWLQSCTCTAFLQSVEGASCEMHNTIRSCSIITLQIAISVAIKY